MGDQDSMVAQHSPATPVENQCHKRRFQVDEEDLERRSKKMMLLSPSHGQRLANDDETYDVFPPTADTNLCGPTSISPGIIPFSSSRLERHRRMRDSLKEMDKILEELEEEEVAYSEGRLDAAILQGFSDHKDLSSSSSEEEDEEEEALRVEKEDEEVVRVEKTATLEEEAADSDFNPQDLSGCKYLSSQEEAMRVAEEEAVRVEKAAILEEEAEDGELPDCKKLCVEGGGREETAIVEKAVKVVPITIKCAYGKDHEVLLRGNSFYYKIV